LKASHFALKINRMYFLFEIKIFGGNPALELFTTETFKTTRDADDFGSLDSGFGDNMPSDSR
jgi:hypothetical protein